MVWKAKPSYSETKNLDTFVVRKGNVGGLAIYIVHLIATAVNKLFHDFLLLDQQPKPTQLSNGVGFCILFFGFSPPKFGVGPENLGKMAFFGCREIQ